MLVFLSSEPKQSGCVLGDAGVEDGSAESRRSVKYRQKVLYKKSYSK